MKHREQRDTLESDNPCKIPAHSHTWVFPKSGAPSLGGLQQGVQNFRVYIGVPRCWESTKGIQPYLLFAVKEWRNGFAQITSNNMAVLIFCSNPSFTTDNQQVNTKAVSLKTSCAFPFVAPLQPPTSRQS